MKTPELLTRDTFRESVFERDNHKCVICGEPAKDAHHIMERRLFTNTHGYFIDNGASLCQEHHIRAEETNLTCEEIREAAGITKVIIPSHLYDSQRYDKWGNTILPNESRLKGELFEDESVQKILKQGNVLGQFTKYVKYPRTYHLPWSPGITDDDRVLKSLEGFEGKEVVVQLKLDGENNSLYNDHMHVRSLEKVVPHESRSRVKNLWSNICYNIPEGWRVCCENVYAKHSIHYHNLDDFVYAFSVWNEKNVCLSYDETEEWIELLGLTPCPVLYRGIWDKEKIKKLYSPLRNGDEMEGYVVRAAHEYHYSEFRKYVGKYVRAGHVQNSHGHWIRNAIVYNELKKK